MLYPRPDKSRKNVKKSSVSDSISNLGAEHSPESQILYIILPSSLSRQYIYIIPEAEHAAEKSDTNIYDYRNILASASFEGNPTSHSDTGQLLAR